MTTNLKAQVVRTLRHAQQAARAAALATGMVCPVALGSPGDLDPSFANVGRFYLPDEAQGTVLSIELQDDNVLLSGGRAGRNTHTSDQIYTLGFNYRISDEGAIDDLFTVAPALNNVLVMDSATLPDGKIVGLGLRPTSHLLFRLERDGTLDAGFGVDGILTLQGTVSARSSVLYRSFVLEPDGAIVIARLQANEITVQRVHADGSVDTSFGTNGVFSGAIDASSDQRTGHPRILRALDGGYRVTDNMTDVNTGITRCRVIGVTANGALDTSFGDAGYAGIEASGSVTCNDIAQSPDGGLLVVGTGGKHALLVRLLASGNPDPDFGIDVPPDSDMVGATGVAVDSSTGAVVVAGYPAADVTGGIVTRLLADGSIDGSFGNDGTAWFDLAGNWFLSIDAMHLQPNGDVIVAGARDTRPYAARLVGGDGADGPGVLALGRYNFTASEADQAVVTVRRIGGKTGSVSVAYQTSQPTDSAAADDFTAVSGRLEWADGDTTDKQFFIPIAQDAGPPEDVEFFGVQLSDAQGGAGLGTLASTIGINADGSPGGLFAVESGGWFDENYGTLGISVERRHYTQGAVSVTLVPHSGTATVGEDLSGDPVTLTWADGESGAKIANFAITDDSNEEPDEDFSFELTDATGGAVIGPSSTTSWGIFANDAPEPRPQPTSGGGGGGGGGRIGWLSLLLIGFARLRRRSTLHATD